MLFEVSLIAKAPRDRVYAAYVDFESMPKWSHQVATVRISKREGDTVFLESVDASGRRNREVPRTVRLFPPFKVQSESETRFTSTKATVTFEDVQEGCKVTAAMVVEVKGAWARILTTRGRDEVEPRALEELTSFVRYAEGLP